MSAVVGTVKWFLSGGASNTNPFSSLGGVMSNTIRPTQFFPDIPQTESFLGSDSYLCAYIKNDNPVEQTLSIALLMAVWINNDFSGPDTLNIAFDPAGVGNGVTTGVATTIADINTAPSGVTFPSSVPFGPPPPTGTAGVDTLTPTTLQPQEVIAVWHWRHLVATTQGALQSQATLGRRWGA